MVKQTKANVKIRLTEKCELPDYNLQQKLYYKYWPLIFIIYVQLKLGRENFKFSQY